MNERLGNVCSELCACLNLTVSRIFIVLSVEMKFGTMKVIFIPTNEKKLAITEWEHPSTARWKGSAQRSAGKVMLIVWEQNWPFLGHSMSTSWNVNSTTYSNLLPKTFMSAILHSRCGVASNVGFWSITIWNHILLMS